MSVLPDARRGTALRASVLVTADARGGVPGVYDMFDVETVDTGGARLIGPLLLEVGEQLVLRVARGERSVDVAARVTAVEPGEHDAVSVLAFLDVEGAAGDALRAVVSA